MIKKIYIFDSSLWLLLNWPMTFYLSPSIFFLAHQSLFSFCSVSGRKVVMQLQIINYEQAFAIYIINMTGQCLQTLLFPVCILEH